MSVATGEIIRITANDGTTVEYVDDEPKQGAIKDVYFSPDRSYVVAFFRKRLQEAGLRRIENLVGSYHDAIFNRVGGEYWRHTFCWPEKIVEYKGRHGVVMPAYAPNFFFKSGNIVGEEKEGKWWASAKNYNRFVPPEERGTLGGFLNACLEMSRAVRRMHAAGLAHSDLSYKNCLIDPVGGRACIIDVDGLVVPGLFPPDVLGTRGFMPPEVVATQHLSRNDPNRVFPSRTTDLHALAVFIYLCLLHRHPLEGQSFTDLPDEEQEKMQMGEGALFIEHPTDPTNRRRVGRGEEIGLPWVDPTVTPYTICGPYLKTLFDQAFIEGLHSPIRRPAGDDWEDAITRTLDLLLPCANPKCLKREFVFDGQGRPTCPYCGTAYKDSVPILEFFTSRNGVDYLPDNRMLIVNEGKELFLWHVDRFVSNNEKLKPEQLERVGYFSKDGDSWVLNNERIEFLYDLTDQKPVPCGGSIVLTENMRLSLCDEKRTYVAQVRIVNRSRQGGLSDASLGLSLEVADTEQKQASKRVDAALRVVQSFRFPLARVGTLYRYKLSFKNLRVDDKRLQVALLETRGFEEFGLTCRVEKDSLILEGTPTREYDGKIDFYLTGRFRDYHLFGGRTRIPGEFKFSNVHLSKTWAIRAATTPADEIGTTVDDVDSSDSNEASALM